MAAELEPHKLANLLPMMTDKEFARLKTDIADVGLQNPILLFEGKILDGRNRYKACRELGVELKTQEFKGKNGDASSEEALNYVVSANLQRRQLKASQRAILGLKLLPLVQEEVHKARREKLQKAAKSRTQKALWGDAGGASGQVRAKSPGGERPEDIRVRKIVADMLGIGERLITEAQFLKEKAPDKLKLVEEGKLRMNTAVAPLRKGEVRRGRKPLTPIQRAAGLLRRAKKALGRAEADLGKKIEDLATELDKAHEAEVPAKAPAAKKKGKKAK